MRIRHLIVFLFFFNLTFTSTVRGKGDVVGILCKATKEHSLTDLQLSKRIKASPCKTSLIATAKNVAATFGPAYVPYFKDSKISAHVFQRNDYGDNHRKIRKRIGREYFEITFSYDTTTVRFAFDYAAKVRIWKDTGEPLDVIFGNGMGRNFFFKSFKKQSKRSVIHHVPLQIEKKQKSIWD